MIKYASCFFLLFFTLTVYCQNSYTVEGLIINKEKKPLESVVVKLIKHNDSLSKVKYYAITDKHGKFIIKNVVANDYDIQIVSLNYKDQTKQLKINDNLNLKFILEEDVKQLDEVIVKAKKKILKQTDEGIKLNVAGTKLSDFNSMSEILSLSPNISMVNGIEIVGNKNIGIIFNGVQLKLKPSQIPVFLQSIKPKTVKNIEIIDRVDASYDTKISGVIKINTVDDVGTMGTLSSGLVYNDFFGLNNDFSIYYNKSKIRLYANVYKSDKKIKFTEEENQITGDAFFYDTNKSREFKRQERVATVGLDYKIDSLNTISVLYDFTEDNDKDFNILSATQINTPEAIDSLIVGDTKLDHLNKVHTVSLQYNKALDSLNSYFRVSSDYVSDNFKNPYAQKQQFYANTVFVEENLTNQSYNTLHNIFGLQIDWNKNYANGTNFKAGAKYSFGNIDEDYFFINKTTTQTLSNVFNYNENILSAYVSYRYKFKKSTLTLGLRNEYNFNTFGNNNRFDKKTDNFNILPTLYYVYNINKKNRTYFYFSKRIERPSYYQFNPSLQVSNAILQSSGNENLTPVDIYRFQTGYTYKNKYTAILRYDYRENVIILNSIFNDNTGITFSQPVNSGYFHYALVYLSIPVKFFDWWESNNKVNFKYTNYFSPLFLNEDFESFYSTFDSSHTFYLPRNIYINLGFNYVAKNKYLNTTNDAVFTSNFILSMPFIKDKFRFNLSITDLFKTQRNNYLRRINNIYSVTRSVLNSRGVYINFSYNFSSGKEIDDTLIEPIIEDEKRRSGH